MRIRREPPELLDLVASIVESLRTQECIAPLTTLVGIAVSHHYYRSRLVTPERPWRTLHPVGGVETARVGDGWGPLLLVGGGMTEDALIEDPQIDYPVGMRARAREKWGALDLTVTPSNEATGEVVAAIAFVSMHVCERCGAPGRLRRGRAWWKTLCD